MARLFICYKREDKSYAFALREWLIDVHGWTADDIFVDLDHVRAGDQWAKKLFEEAEAAEVMLFIASNEALSPDSFCYRELRQARGTTIAVTLRGLDPADKRLQQALPYGATARQITALDQQPTSGFEFTSPVDGKKGVVGLNRRQVDNINETLRNLGIAPNSFDWKATPEGPYPGLRALQEGDEGIFFGRDIEIRNCIRLLEELKTRISSRVLIIQAPSGAGKSSFLRAGNYSPLCGGLTRV
jgi:TIR domain